MKLRHRIIRLLALRHPRIAVIGAMRSGTNLLTAVLRQHWHINVDESAYGWKHSGVPVFSPLSRFRYRPVPILLVTKNPYAFALSLFQYSDLDHNEVSRISIRGKRNFNEFLRSPIYIWDSQLPRSPEMRFSDPIEYWNFLNWNIVSLHPDRFRHLHFRYEDLLENPSILQQISKLTTAKRKSGEICLPAKTLKRGKGVKTAKSEDIEFDETFYREKKYLTHLNDEQITFITSRVDRELMARLGYDVIGA